MDIKELITFKTVVEQKSFSAAADFLGYSQPNVTKHIKKIEEYVGFELFVRGWSSSLTRQGELLYKEVDNLLDHWKSVLIISDEIANEQIGEIRIGIIESLAKKIIPKIIEWLEVYRPKMSAEFDMGNTKRMYELVQSNKIDMAFCGEDLESAYQLDFKKFAEEKILFVVHADHELLKTEKLAMLDILDYPLVMGDKTCISNRKFMKVLEKNKLLHRLKKQYICSNPMLIPAILPANYIGILTQSSMVEKTDDIEILTYEDSDLEMIYGIVTKKREYDYLEKTVKQMIELLK